MDLLIASNIFYKYAQTVKTLDLLKKTSNILAAPYINQNLQSGLIATLENRIKMFPIDPALPISRQDSKDAMRNLYNAIKIYYNSLVTNQEITDTINKFEDVKKQWDNYIKTYFTNEFILSLSSKNQKTYLWWSKLRQKIIDGISSIDKLLIQANTENGTEIPDSGKLII